MNPKSKTYLDSNLDLDQPLPLGATNAWSVPFPNAPEDNGSVRPKYSTKKTLTRLGWISSRYRQGKSSCKLEPPSATHCTCPETSPLPDSVTTNLNQTEDIKSVPATLDTTPPDPEYIPPPITPEELEKFKEMNHNLSQLGSLSEQFEVLELERQRLNHRLHLLTLWIVFGILIALLILIVLAWCTLKMFVDNRQRTPISSEALTSSYDDPLGKNNTGETENPSHTSTLNPTNDPTLVLLDKSSYDFYAQLEQLRKELAQQRLLLEEQFKLLEANPATQSELESIRLKEAFAQNQYQLLQEIIAPHQQDSTSAIQETASANLANTLKAPSQPKPPPKAKPGQLQTPIAESEHSQYSLNPPTGVIMTNEIDNPIPAVSNGEPRNTPEVDANDLNSEPGETLRW